MQIPCAILTSCFSQHSQSPGQPQSQKTTPLFLSADLGVDPKLRRSLGNALRLWTRPVMSVYRFAYYNLKKNHKKIKSSHSPGLPRHSHVAPAVNSVGCTGAVTLSGSPTGHWENQILTPPLQTFMSLSHLFHVVWQNQIHFE